MSASLRIRYLVRTAVFVVQQRTEPRVAHPSYIFRYDMRRGGHVGEYPRDGDAHAGHGVILRGKAQRVRHWAGSVIALVPLEVKLFAVFEHELAQAVLVTLRKRLLQKLMVARVALKNVEQRVIIREVSVDDLPARYYPVEVYLLYEVVFVPEMVVKSLALEANARGLALVPGDYEFTRQQTELEQGKTLEEMENHYINEEADRKLMEGLLTEERDEKLFAISGIVCNRPQLSENLAALEISGWVPNTPYCFGTIPHGTEGTQFTAMMNEAAFSKVSPVWLAELRSRIPDLDRQALEWLEHRFPDLPEDIRLGEIRLYRAHELQLSYSPASGGDGLSLPVSKDWSISDPGFWGDTWKLAVSADSRSLFTAILLLENPDWDWDQLCRDLKSDWGISCKLSEKQPNRLMFESDSLLGTLTLGNFPIPNGEAEQIAANNYLWSEAVETVGRHQANIVAAVFGKGAAPIDSGKLLVKLCASCCRQENVLGVYTSGTVFEPSFYLRSALVMRDGDLPVLDWIYFGLYRSDNGISGYTYGLENFGKREIEVLDSNTKPVELRDFLFNIAYYILDNDMEFHDGETIGFSEHQKLPITLSAGVAVDGMSFKISYRKKPVTKSK